MPTRNFLPSKSGRDNHWWDIFPIASIRSNHNELNSYWGRAANQNEFGHQKECVICENEFCIWTGCHITTYWASQGAQRCICRDIQRLERYSTRNC